jgi:hypothetical protein
MFQNWYWLIPTALGAVLAVMGGLGSARLQSWLEYRRTAGIRMRRLMVAIDQVLAELDVNRETIERAMAGDGPVAALPLSFGTYQRVEMVLGEGLPISAQETLFKAYRPLRAGDLYRTWEAISGYHGGAPVGYGELDAAECRRELQRLREAARQLRLARQEILDTATRGPSG